MFKREFVKYLSSDPDRFGIRNPRFGHNDTRDFNLCLCNDLKALQSAGDINIPMGTHHDY